MGKKRITTIGIEYDNRGIRAAKVTASKRGKYIKYNIDKLQEVRGSFEKNEELIDALKKIKKLKLKE